MTPAKEAKKACLKGLGELCEISGQSRQTLDNWFKSKEKRFVFDAVLHYAVFSKNIGESCSIQK